MIKVEIKEISENIEITNEGEVDEYLGVKVEKLKDNRVKMSQQYLIDQILLSSNMGIKDAD